MDVKSFLGELVTKMKEILAVTKDVTTKDPGEENIVSEVKAGFNKLLIAVLKTKKELSEKVKETKSEDVIKLREVIMKESGISPRDIDDQVEKDKKFGISEKDSLKCLIKELEIKN